MNKASLTIWRCSDNAKHADFGIKTRKRNTLRHQNDATGKICPNGKEAIFGIVQRKNSLKLRYLKAAYYYAMWDLSYGITSRELVRQVPTHNRLFTDSSLGEYFP